jgi:hypothetical protein
MFHADLKGHTGYCIGFGRVEFFWFKSQKQTMVCTSSTQAEMRALCTLVNDLIYLIDLCQELKMPLNLPNIVMEDNAALIQLATEECAMIKGYKHFLKDINYVRQYVDNLIIIKKIEGEENVADLMSKILRGSQLDDDCKLGKLLGTTRPLQSEKEYEEDDDHNKRKGTRTANNI